MKASMTGMQVGAGTVLEIGSADSLIKEPFRDCRKDPRVAELKASTFAVVSYPFLNRPRKAVVPVPLQRGGPPGALCISTSLIAQDQWSRE